MTPGRLVAGTAVAETDSSAGWPRGTRRGRDGMMQRAMQSRNLGKLRSNQLKQNAASGHSHTHTSYEPMADSVLNNVRLLRAANDHGRAPEGNDVSAIPITQLARR